MYDVAVCQFPKIKKFSPDKIIVILSGERKKALMLSKSVGIVHLNLYSLGTRWFVHTSKYKCRLSRYFRLSMNKVFAFNAEFLKKSIDPNLMVPV